MGYTKMRDHKRRLEEDSTSPFDTREVETLTHEDGGGRTVVGCRSKPWRSEEERGRGECE